MTTPDQIWPVSIAGWVGLTASLIALFGMIFGSGRFFGKLEELVKAAAAVELKLVEIDEKMTFFEHILIGPMKNNGLVSKVDQLGKRVDLIQERNTRIDAVRAREEGAQQAGIESRMFNRRVEDKIIRGENDG